MRILIIEDEQKVSQALQAGLEGQGFAVAVAQSGEQGLSLLNAGSYDLLILDLLLPGTGGLEVLRDLRQRRNLLPVLILTARDSVEDRVEGLETGGDDYLIKPFAFPELVARVHALLRRGQHESRAKYSVADLEMDLLGRKVWRGGQLIALTGREMSLLEFLLRHQGKIVSREMIARHVWEETMRATSLDNVIDVHIAHLRKKIDEPYAHKLLHTVRGVGFLLSEQRP